MNRHKEREMGRIRRETMEKDIEEHMDRDITGEGFFKNECHVGIFITNSQGRGNWVRRAHTHLFGLKG